MRIVTGLAPTHGRLMDDAAGDGALSSGAYWNTAALMASADAPGDASLRDWRRKMAAAR